MVLFKTNEQLLQHLVKFTGCLNGALPSKNISPTTLQNRKVPNFFQTVDLIETKLSVWGELSYYQVTHILAQVVVPLYFNIINKIKLPIS